MALNVCILVFYKLNKWSGRGLNLYHLQCGYKTYFYETQLMTLSYSAAKSSMQIRTVNALLHYIYET